MFRGALKVNNLRLPFILRVGANPNAKAVSLGELPAKANYLLGNDPKKRNAG